MPAAVLSLAAAVLAPASAQAAPRAQLTHAPAEFAKTGEYLVKLKPGAPIGAVLSRARVGRTVAEWPELDGFAARLNPAQLDRLRTDPRVTQVAENALIPNTASSVQADAPWGPDR